MIHLNIGSNLNSHFGNRFANISIAIKLLIKEKFIIKKISNFYATPSYPNKKLPDFLNIGLIGTFSKRVEELRNIIAVIERKIGRVKTKKNDPRVCDIDIIDFNGKTLSIGDLTIPHKKCHQRNFVLFPISQIALHILRLPGCAKIFERSASVRSGSAPAKRLLAAFMRGSSADMFRSNAPVSKLFFTYSDA